jgi:hypothetical protein
VRRHVELVWSHRNPPILNTIGPTTPTQPLLVTDSSSISGVYVLRTIRGDIRMLLEDERTERGDVARSGRGALTGRECPWRYDVRPLAISPPAPTRRLALSRPKSGLRKKPTKQGRCGHSRSPANASNSSTRAVPASDYGDIAALR